MCLSPMIDCIFSGMLRGLGSFRERSKELQSSPIMSLAFGVKNVIIAVAVPSVSNPLKLYLHIWISVRVEY